MTVTYLDNSGFAVRIDDMLLIFDYWKDTGKRGLAHGTVDPAELGAYRRVVALVSHAHPDHFNPVIMSWPNVEHVLSYDIPAAYPGPRLRPGDALRLPGEEDALAVEAFGSTDQGVSFLVSARGRLIFHAGDLNCWHWQEESTPKEAAEARAFFTQTLAPIAARAEELRAQGKTVDIAFLPVDPRLGQNCDEGALAMARALSPRVIVPMHAHGGRAAVEAFARKYGGDVRVLLERGGTAEL